MGNDIQFAHTTEEIQGVLDTYGSEYTALDKSFEQLNVLTKNPSELEHLERAHTLAIKTDKVARKLFDVLMRDDASPMGKFQIAIAGMHKIEKLTAQIMDDVALLSASFETQAREKKSELELNINAIEGLAFGSLIALSLFGIKSMLTGRPPSSKNS
jgi:tetrahydromethanopterin S-methyltransferase subunit F